MVKKFLSDLKDRFEVSSEDVIDEGEQYVELSARGQRRKGSEKILVRPYILEDFSDVKPIVDALRGRQTIALINIAQLKEKDLVELKRAVNKLKKTVDAIDGDIAGFSDDYIVAAPDYAEVYRQPGSSAMDEE